MGIGAVPTARGLLALGGQHLGMLACGLHARGHLAVDHGGAVGCPAFIDKRGRDGHGGPSLGLSSPCPACC